MTYSVLLVKKINWDAHLCACVISLAHVSIHFGFNVHFINTLVFYIIINTIRDGCTELRLRKVGTSDWFYTPSSDFGSDNLESRVITKIERFDCGQSERAPTSFDLSPGEFHPYFSIVACYLRMCIVLLFIFD